MPLPTSTIAMAVLTCIPFGLAIHETATGKAPVARGDDSPFGDDDPNDGEADYARYQAERAAEEAEEEAKQRLEELKTERLRTARRQFYGAEVATLGSGFRGITLGMPEGDIRSETLTALENETAVDIELLANTTLDWIMVKPERGASEDDSAELCSALGKELQDAWGRGLTEDYNTRYWLNASTKTRASLGGSEDCSLHFDRYATPAEWVNKTKTSIVPLWLIGQSIAKLREHLGARAEFEATDSDVRWFGVGVGTGTGEARFEAHVAKGKVVAIVATANTFESTREEVMQQLTTLYGSEIEDDNGVRWKSRPAIALDDYEGAGIRLTAGKLPDAE